MEWGKSFWKSLLLCGIRLCALPLLRGSSSALGRRPALCKDGEDAILQTSPLNLLWKIVPWGGGCSASPRSRRYRCGEEGGRTCYPFPGERELHFSVWETLPFLLRACKGELCGGTKQGFGPEQSRMGANASLWLGEAGWDGNKRECKYTSALGRTCC